MIRAMILYFSSTFFTNFLSLFWTQTQPHAALLLNRKLLESADSDCCSPKVSSESPFLVDFLPTKPTRAMLLPCIHLYVYVASAFLVRITSTKTVPTFCILRESRKQVHSIENVHYVPRSSRIWLTDLLCTKPVRDIKKRNHEFTNLKCCIIAREPFETPFWWCIISYLSL